MNLKFLYVVPALILLSSCATLPTAQHKPYLVPSENFFVEEPIAKDLARPYEIKGWVRSKASFSSLEADTHEAQALCQNYYNKAAQQLLREAKKAGADAVMKVRSVVLLLNGKVEEHTTAECADDGAEGEILLKGIAVKWKE